MWRSPSALIRLLQSVRLSWGTQQALAIKVVMPSHRGLRISPAGRSPGAAAIGQNKAVLAGVSWLSRLLAHQQSLALGEHANDLLGAVPASLYVMWSSLPHDGVSDSHNGSVQGIRSSQPGPMQRRHRQPRPDASHRSPFAAQPPESTVSSAASVASHREQGSDRQAVLGGGKSRALAA